MRRKVIICVCCCNILLILLLSCSEPSKEVRAEKQTDLKTETVFEKTEADQNVVATTSATQREISSDSNTTTTVHTTKKTTVSHTITEASTTILRNLTSAPYEGLYNARTMECICSKSSDVLISPASLTKILTACVALKYVSPEKVFTVGTEQSFVSEGSSLCLIKSGHRLKLHDLLTGMLLSSGNDAAYTVAVNVSREVSGNKNMNDSEAVSYFAKLMNEYAYAIGARNSNFTNPDGWDDEEQYSSVYDLALISANAIQIKEIRNIASSCSKYVVFESGENVTWSNSNSLLQPGSKYYMPQAIGLKTGTTAKAGYCLIAVVSVESEEYIAVVIGCKSNDERYESVQRLTGMIK